MMGRGKVMGGGGEMKGWRRIKRFSVEVDRDSRERSRRNGKLGIETRDGRQEGRGQSLPLGCQPNGYA